MPLTLPSARSPQPISCAGGQSRLILRTKKQLALKAGSGLPEREIQATDEQIDQLVYELHGLTEDEIRKVERDGKTRERIG
jgi:hypothetical protein